MKYRLPPRFYDDHQSRDLPSGAVLRRTKTYVEVELTEAEKDEILSDASHYSHDDSGLGTEYRGLIASARATIRALS